MSTNGDWQSTACILCSENCGIEVQVGEGRRLNRIRGDKAHPHSKGYLCQKATRLDHYQNHADRLTEPLRRKADGTFEAVSWETAISEIAAKLVAIRDTHGGECLAFAGGGGQGNHLGGIYSNALKAAMKTRYHYSSLAQEKTGGFWVNGKLFGRQSCYPAHDVEHADFVLFLGTNPWQSHGIARARTVLQEIRKDPNRTMVVVDPWRTKTAEMADVHLAVKPGRDAYLLAGMLGIIFQEGLEDQVFLDVHCEGGDSIRAIFREIPVDAYVEYAGLDPKVVRRVTRQYATTEAATIRADLGLEHTFHSTLNDYLGKLLFLTTGHFGRRGTNNLLAQFIPLLGHSGDPETDANVAKTQVTGAAEISKLYPPNVLPQEIDTEHPNRTRGVVVDSMNPVVTGADTQAYESAFGKLELLVVIDVAMTETAALAHYVLPAATQFEKHEATFFGSGVPEHFFHLRQPLFDPPAGALDEPEIYRRLLTAMGETAESSPLLGVINQLNMMAPHLREKSDNFKSVAGPIFLSSQRYAEKFPDAVQNAGIQDEGMGLGAALFNAIISSPSGVQIGEFKYEQSFDFIRHRDGKIHLVNDTLLGWLGDLESEMASGRLEDREYPFLMSAGGRRSYNANTIYRDPAWRLEDTEGALWIHPADLESIGATDGGEVVCESRRGSVRVRAKANDSAQRGFVNLPHGYGLSYPGADGERVQVGAMANMLTSLEDCDPIAKTPYHKNVPVRIRPA